MIFTFGNGKGMLFPYCSAITLVGAQLIVYLSLYGCSTALLINGGQPKASAGNVVEDFTWGDNNDGWKKGNSEMTNDGRVANSKIGCKDEEGKDVEWFIVYKLPKNEGSTKAKVKEGSSHYYLLPGESGWTESSLAINDSKSLIGRTVEILNVVGGNGKQQQLEKDVAVVLYNDQPPEVDPIYKDGHTKGVIITNSDGGFWMPHSVPHFPKVNGTFYPSGGLINGQMLFCLSLSVGTINKVLGGALLYTKATFYNSSIPSSLETSLSDIQDVITNNKTAVRPFFNEYDIKLKDLDVTLLAKGPKFHREIYADWISPRFNSSLDVQSWLQGTHPFASNCTSKYTVLNVLEKSFKGENFSNVDDHSKWAVGQDVELTCIADLNRMKPQKGRGGLALCIRDKTIWAAFKDLVIQTQPCSLSKPLARTQGKSFKKRYEWKKVKKQVKLTQHVKIFIK